MKWRAMIDLKRMMGTAIGIVLSLLLTGCFLSNGLFERERIWDPVWFGRYEAEGIMFVVLPDDPVKRTYLVGSFEGAKTSIDTYRVALYRGWSGVFIIGSITLGKNETRAVYSLLRPQPNNRFASDWPNCDEEFADSHDVVSDETCSFASLETLRTALKAYAAEKAAKPPGDSNLDPRALERRRDRPLSTIGVTARAGIVTDSEGVHGGLTLLDVPRRSPAGKAGLKRSDVIIAIGNPRPAIGEELLLRIAAAPPKTALVVTYFDGKTRAKRQATVITAALE
jgi:hypothetical protein